MAAIKTIGYKRRNMDASEEFRPSCDVQEVSAPWMPATMVQHNGPHERVFTESEVKAMLMRASHLAEQHTGKWVSFSGILDPA